MKKYTKLEELREKNGLSCSNMSKLIGISRVYYWQIETGDRNLSYSLAVKIAKILKTKPDIIFLEDYNKYEKELEEKKKQK